MKNVKKLLALLLAMVMLFTLCACTITVDDKEKDDDKKSGSSKSDLVGSWECDGAIMTLKKNGSGELEYEGETLDLEWEVDGDEITIVMSSEDESEEITMEWEIDGNKLTFIDEDGEEEIWYKEGTTPEEDEDKTDKNDKNDKEDNKTDSSDNEVSASTNSGLIGSWECDGAIMTLKKNGSGELEYEGDTLDLEWEVDGDEITIVMSVDGESEEITLEWEIDGNKLIFIDEDGEEEIWYEEGTAPEEDEDDFDYGDYEDDYEDDFDYDYDFDLDDKLVGVWECDGVEMTLYSNGSGIIDVDGVEIEVEWVTVDGAIAFLMEGDEYYGEYTVRNGKLTIDYDDGTTEIWTEA